MPQEINEEIKSEEVQEIITMVPTWLLRWGITMIFAILICILLLSILIRYPDVVAANLKVNSLNSPKEVLAKQTGKITRLLVKDSEMVYQNQPLAFFESIGTPEDILLLNKELKNFLLNFTKNSEYFQKLPENLSLGEIQTAYQNFYQQYLEYQSTQKNGYYMNKIAFLERDLRDVNKLRNNIVNEQSLKLKEYRNREVEYRAYQKLYKDKVISRSEFGQQENLYFASKQPLNQIESALLNNTSSYSSKEKELLDLKHLVIEERAKFLQSLNMCIVESENWIFIHILKAPVSGKLVYAGIIQESQNVNSGQEIFIINPGNIDFFGEVQIPQYDMGKIKKGEKALVKLKSYPFEQYGLIRGTVSYVSDVVYKDSLFVAKIDFNHFEDKDSDRKIVLKNGMQARVEIITDESSLFNRFFRNLAKVVNN